MFAEQFILDKVISYEKYPYIVRGKVYIFYSHTV